MGMTPSRTTPLLFPNTPLSDMSLNSDIDFAAGGTPWGHRTNSSSTANSTSNTTTGNAVNTSGTTTGAVHMNASTYATSTSAITDAMGTPTASSHNAALVSHYLFIYNTYIYIYINVILIHFFIYVKSIVGERQARAVPRRFHVPYCYY